MVSCLRRLSRIERSRKVSTPPSTFPSWSKSGAALIEMGNSLPARVLIEIERFVTGLQEDDELCNYVLWSRNRYRHFKITNSTDRVEGVDLVVLGHTPVEHPIHISNICYLDTGAAYKTRKGLGKLSVLEIQPNLKLYQLSTRKKSRSWLRS